MARRGWTESTRTRTWGSSAEASQLNAFPTHNSSFRSSPFMPSRCMLHSPHFLSLFLDLHWAQPHSCVADSSAADSPQLSNIRALYTPGSARMQQFNWPSGVSRGQLELRSSSVTRNLPSTSSKRGLPAKTGELVASTHTRPCAPNRLAGHEGELHGQSSTTLSDVLKVCGGVWGSREVNCRDPERSVPGIRRAISASATEP